MSGLIHVATITSPHGVKGQFKLNCLLESSKLLAALPALLDEQQQPFALQYVSIKSKQPIALHPDIKDRNEAEALKGKKLFARASDFPQTDTSEYYSHELIGLQVKDKSGHVVGRVTAHQNFGAGDILEVEFVAGTMEMLPFNDDTFPEVDIAAGFVTYVEPKYL